MCSSYSACAGNGGCVFERTKVKDVVYEIHVTVRPGNVKIFQQACSRLGIKPVLLDLQLKNEIMKDMMTSETMTGSLESAKARSLTVARVLTEYGFTVVRRKIETVPWHPEAKMMKPGQYFECHVAITCNDDRYDELKQISELHGAHLSRNVFKQVDNGNYVVMSTIRHSDLTHEAFGLKVETFKIDLRQANFEVHKTITEFAIFDTNVDHDRAWVTAY